MGSAARRCAARRWMDELEWTHAPLLRAAGALSLLAAYGLLVTLRIAFAGGTCGIYPSSHAYMADITTQEKRTAGMSLIGIAMGVGTIAGPGLVAVVSGWGLAFPFYAVAALAVPAALRGNLGWLAQPQ